MSTLINDLHNNIDSVVTNKDNLFYMVNSARSRGVVEMNQDILEITIYDLRCVVHINSS